MSTLVAVDGAAVAARPGPVQRAAVALLGCGTVGAAVARLLESERSVRAQITCALVRRPERRRAVSREISFSSDPTAVVGPDIDLVVEVLGGTEPARTLVLDALRRGQPVVTANKTLLARHGAELRRASRVSGTPLLYEAAVLAGVPFLGTFARRPLSAVATGLLGIVNGTSNYLLTRAAQENASVVAALPDAQQLGYAEPDPAKDLAGTDAAEKLAVLLQHFAHVDVHPDSIETQGIDTLSAWTLRQARELASVVKPVVQAAWSGDLEAFVGPTLVPDTHPLARVDGVENALLLEGARGRLLFQGPGAGPDVTAATVLDDVAEVLDGVAGGVDRSDLRPARVGSPETGWLLSISGPHLPRGADVADYLGSFGVYVRSTTAAAAGNGEEHRGYLTWPAPTAQVRSAADRLAAAAACRVTCIRALGALA